MSLQRIISQGILNGHLGSFLPELRNIKNNKNKYSQRIQLQSPLPPEEATIEDFNLEDARITDSNKLIAIFNNRYNKKPIPPITTAFNEPDFLEFSFLEKGIICGAAVCRLMRKLEDSDILQLFSILQEINSSRKIPYTKDQLVEIFSIKKEDQDIFFKGLSDDESYRAFNNISLVKQFFPEMPAGTGFLVGNKYLLTADHVLNNINYLKNLSAEFNYQKLINGDEDTPVRYEVEEAVVRDETLDYALLRLNTNFKEKEVESKPNYISLLTDETLIAPPLTFKQAEGFDNQLSEEVKKRLARAKSIANHKNGIQGIDGEPVTIIQHPKGKHKQVVMSSNRVIAISEDCLYYESDAESGSSGSPIFNQEWQLVGLHRGYISESESKDIEGDIVVGYEGKRTCKIAQDLSLKAQNAAGENKEEIRKFIEQFVDKPLPWHKNIEFKKSLF